MLTFFILSLVVACIAWTVTQEEIFREPRSYCVKRSKCEKSAWYCRKFFYLFTCNYCFSHWVTAILLVFTRFTLVYTGALGYIVALFAIVYTANFIMSIYRRLRLSIKTAELKAKLLEKELKS